MTEKRVPQPMRPSGLAGRLFGVIMEWAAKPNYRWVIAQLVSHKPRAYLEIGFGTGRLLQFVARETRPAVIRGVDPSELMFNKATKRLRKFRRKIAIDLRLGDVSNLPWDNGSSDAVVASHSFQFWSDPAAALARIRGLLKPDGRLVLVIRSHKQISKNVRAWIPNPITKSGNELEGLRKALDDAGFRISKDEKLKTGSQGIVAECA